MKTIVIASNNAHKAEEIATALAFPGWEFRTLRQLGLDSDPAEDADTFEGNARIKAQAARAASGGLAVLADDSGLAVDALDSEPGVHSARYAGEPCDDAANNAKLLAELADVPDEKRTGRFVCTLVFIDEDGTETVARGTIEGRIGREERGRHGFGYDPLFLPDMFEDGRTLAEALPEEKNAVSHRGNALRELRAKLEKYPFALLRVRETSGILACAVLRRDVAQFGSAPALGAGCRRFESCHPDHLSFIPRSAAKPISAYRCTDPGGLCVGSTLDSGNRFAA